MPNVYNERSFDAVVVGAGFAGLYALYRLRSLGLSVRVFEAGGDVGGTWYWNRYPGARCDVESLEYSYQFSEELQQEWVWTERYASQPEILNYINHVVTRFDLRNHIRFDTRVKSVRFCDPDNHWLVETESGDKTVAQFCIMATGCLSVPNIPHIRGLGSFAGECYHTGQWPQEGVDFLEKRVGVIGTGSSAIQSIPIIATQAEHLYVFQRTATYSVPAQNGSLDTKQEEEVKANYAGFRARNRLQPAALGVEWSDVSSLELDDIDREAEYERRWQQGGFSFIGSFSDLLANPNANKTAADFVRNKIRSIVHDPQIAEVLCPEQVIGCKRLCFDTEYYETFNRDNVTLIDVTAAPIEQIVREGIRIKGKTIALDVIVLATGFDAMTGALNRIEICGRSDLNLRDKWADGPRAYLGLASSDFPNLFLITGPGSPSVLTNMIVSIEQHVDWIAECIKYMRLNGYETIDPQEAAEDRWIAHVNDLAGGTLFPNCNSWYLGANIPDKPRVFMPYLGFADYVERCNKIASDGYTGFDLK